MCWEAAVDIKNNLLPSIASLPPSTSSSPFSSLLSPAPPSRPPTLAVIGIGDAEAGKLFAETVDFPPNLLYADPTGAAYQNIGFYKELGRLFFARATQQAFKDKGKQERVKALLPSYKPGKLIPKDTSLTVQQGGVIVVKYSGKKGEKEGEIVFQHFDEGTGAHADWSEVLAAAVAK